MSRGFAVAANGPKMCRLAGEIADGVLFNWLTPEHAKASAALVREGARAAGRPAPRLFGYVRLAMGPGAADRVAKEGGRYAAIPAYKANFDRMGVKPEATAIVALGVHATDVNEETLALARARPWPRGNVTFERRDAYATSAAPPRCDAGFAAGWLSHVDLARMGEFLDAFHSHLVQGAAVMMFDERDHRNRPLPASRTDAAGNRYEARTLASGERFEIVKNFFDAAALRDALGRRARDLVFEGLRGFWVATWEVT